MLYSDTAKDGKQSRETSPPEVSPKGRGSKVVLSYIFYWRFNAIRLQFIRNNFCRGAIGPAYRSSNVAGAASGTRSFHPWYRRGKGILHPTFRNPILLSQEPVPVYTVIGCHRPGSQAFGPSFPAPHPIPAFLFRFCPDTPSASLLSVVFHTSSLFLPCTAPIPHSRFRSRFCSRPDTSLHPVPAPVALPTPARIYPSPRAPDPLTFATCFRPLPSMAGPKSVDNGNSKAMAAAQGRGHVVQSIRAADRYLSSGE